MNYEQMIQETDNLIRRVMVHNMVSQWILVAVCCALVLIVGYCWVSEHVARMKRIREQKEWEEMQVAMNEPYYRRMG